jgi:hypothetical protein
MNRSHCYIHTYIASLVIVLFTCVRVHAHTHTHGLSNFESECCGCMGWWWMYDMGHGEVNCPCRPALCDFLWWDSMSFCWGWHLLAFVLRSGICKEYIAHCWDAQCADLMAIQDFKILYCGDMNYDMGHYCTLIADQKVICSVYSTD